jgi:hypothetical protein
MSGSKARPTKKRENLHSVKDHDEKLCFRCRLFAVMEELFPNGIDGEDQAMSVLFCLSEITGMITSQLGEDEFKQYCMWAMKWRNAARRGMAEEGIGETRH